MPDDELFEDLDEFNDLDETPSFDFEDDITVPDFGEEEGGVSRTFKVVGALMVLAVIGIVAVIVLLALGRGDELAAGDQTNTAVAKTNVAVEFQYNATLTALAQIDQATQTAVRNAELTATGEAVAAQTQEAVMQTQTAGTATAEFAANQTLAALQTATQDALNAQATADAEQRRLWGSVVDAQGNIFGGVTLRLYKDDGDGVFTPSDRILAPAEQPGAPQVQSLSYGVTVESRLGAGSIAEWTFPAVRGDIISIAADARDTTTMDMFLELVGPNGSVLVGDDDSGEDNNALIQGFTLPQDGTYTVRVSSVAGAGDYTLTLVQGAGAADAGVSYQFNSGGALAQAAISPTPTQELGDILIQIIETTAEGQFDFGTLDPGIYWLELDYDTLPPILQNLVPPGEPLVLQVIVPLAGEVEFVIGEFITGTRTPLPTVTQAGATNTPAPTDTPSVTPVDTLTPTPPPTSTPTLNPIQMTSTAYFFLTRTATPTLPVTNTPTPDAALTLTAMAELSAAGTEVPSPEVTVEGPSLTPSSTALPETGFFSDFGESGGLKGTSGLTVLAIAAVGLLAVVFVARRLRTAA